MKGIQQELTLFSPPSFNEILTARNISNLTISFNKRLNKSWHVTTKANNSRSMVLPSLLEHAPEEIKNTIISWALLKKPFLKKNRKSYYRKKKQLERTVWDYLSTQGVTSKRRVVFYPERFTNKTKGVCFDLQELFDEINQHYFKGQIESYIRWGTSTSKTSYQFYFTDSKNQKHSLITIAGAYDHPSVPEFAVKGVVFHEMLHIAIPPYKKNGRNVMHGPEFKRAEKVYPYLQKWQRWERVEMYKIIRAKKKERKRK
ncbi:MAG: hypothetical protein DRI61_12635 [Chloroflexi bacterium]|nr:MAG: hypothetical protein DRI61_12635 [Chloroflexota bacterium]